MNTLFSEIRRVTERQPYENNSLAVGILRDLSVHQNYSQTRVDTRIEMSTGIDPYFIIICLTIISCNPRQL